MCASTSKKKQENKGPDLDWISKEDAAREARVIRDRVPRASHADWNPATDRKSGAEQLQTALNDFLPHHLPIRYGRMLQSSFSFYRGAAAIMAADLANTPNSGIYVQSCGDCHLMNFGSFATPERKIIFDLNDFDETQPAPWEWDLKRLATSFVIAGLHNGFSEFDASQVVVACVDSYAKHTDEFASMPPLVAWYDSITAEEVLERSKNEEAKKRFLRDIEKARNRYEKGEDFPNMTEIVNGKICIKDSPPLIYHQIETAQPEFDKIVKDVFERYVNSLGEEKKPLLRQYHYQDIAVKVVGIGSVGKVCGILLLLSANNDPLFLQVKEARDSVLEPYTQKSIHENNGQRVVAGQKQMQAASDIFLGWCEGPKGKQFYIRQLRDMKIKPVVEVYDEKSMVTYAKLCGWALARAHSRSGKSALISGYIGKSDKFKTAISEFALEYAHQNNEDYRSLKKAVNDGLIEAFIE